MRIGAKAKRLPQSGPESNDTNQLEWRSALRCDVEIKCNERWMEEEEDSVVGELGEEDHPAVPTWWTSRCIGVVRTSAKVLAHGLYHRRRRRLLLLLEGLRRYCRCRYDGVAFRRKTQSPTRPPPSISKALPAPQPPSDCATDGSETKKEEPCPAAWLQGVGRSRG